MFFDELPEHIKIEGVAHKKKNGMADYYEDYDIYAVQRMKNVYKVTKKIMTPYSRGIRKRVMEEDDARRVPGLAQERMEMFGFNIEETMQMYMIIDPYVVRKLGEKEDDNEYKGVLKMLQKATDYERIGERLNRVAKKKGYKIAGIILENTIAKANGRTNPSEPISFGYVGSIVRKEGEVKVGYNYKDKRVKRMNDEILTRNTNNNSAKKREGF